MKVSELIHTIVGKYPWFSVDSEEGRVLAAKVHRDEAIDEAGSLDQYFEELFRENDYRPIEVQFFASNGNRALLKKQKRLVHSDHQPVKRENSPQIQTPNTPLGGMDATSQYLFNKLEADYRELKADFKELQEKKGKLEDDNRELRTNLAIAEQKQTLALQEERNNHSKSLGGFIDETLKPDNLASIKDIIMAIKGNGADAANALPQIAGIEPEKAEVIKGIVAMLKTQDKDTVDNLYLVFNFLCEQPAHIKTLVDQMYKKSGAEDAQIVQEPSSTGTVM